MKFVNYEEVYCNKQDGHQALINSRATEYNIFSKISLPIPGTITLYEHVTGKLQNSKVLNDRNKKKLVLVDICFYKKKFTLTQFLFLLKSVFIYKIGRN